MELSRWYRVLTYDPIAQTCVLAPASQCQSGIIYDVPILAWGGNWQDQKRVPLQLTQPVDPGAWGSSDQGPRWGVTFPVQQGDLAKVEYLDGAAVVTGFAKGILGSQGPAIAAEEQGESIDNRFDLLLPSGAWARSLGDGSWVLSTGPVGNPAAQITLAADGTITLDGSALVINTPTITVNGQTSFTEAGQVINGKEIAVVGAPDSRGDRLTGSNQ